MRYATLPCMAFSNPESDQLENHQGGDFELEERIKSLKRMAPKEKVSSGM